MTAALNTHLHHAMFGMRQPHVTGLMSPIAGSVPLSVITQPNLPLDLSSLDDILQRIDRSSSWAYLHGLVPIYDLAGREIKNIKTPPWPWEILPAAVVKAGKKAWLTQHIDQWIIRISMRANGLEDTLRPLDASWMEKAHG